MLPLDLPQRCHTPHSSYTRHSQSESYIGVAANRKSTSILTAVTAISRVLISFLPLGTLATFKLVRGTRWLSSTDQRPPASPEAQEFWKMWCEGERGVKLTSQDAEKFFGGHLSPDRRLVAQDGRVAFAVPMPPSKFRGREGFILDLAMNPSRIQTRRERRWVIRFLKGSHFRLQDLPFASVPYYTNLSTSQRSEVDELRRYWVGLKMFRDSLRLSRWLTGLLLILPTVLLTGVYLCGLERTPLTGRWRIILLTPEEEDAIATSLAGANWYRSVIKLLTTIERPAPPVLSYDDYRWKWAQATLRRLEAAALEDSHSMPTDEPRLVPGSIISIPPSQYPLKPRPRMSWMLHSMLPGADDTIGWEHLEIGPPYSLMIMEKNEQNAFSYGFGGKGASGIVIFTGLFDAIFRKTGLADVKDAGATSSNGLFSRLFGSSTPRPPHPQPTKEQTLHLACVLAHEMGHLLLSHHVETLSQQQVLWPSALGLSIDLLRAFIWPLTIFLGPTVNDALANVGRTSAKEMSDWYGEIGYQWKHEYEADLAGLRILALAGFDPHAALDHFASVADLHEIQPLDKDDGTSITGRLFKLWTRTTHPSVDQRTAVMRGELERWEREAKQGNKG